MQQVRDVTKSLEDNQTEAADKINHAMDTIIQQLTNAVNQRRAILQERLTNQAHERKAALDTQLSELQAMYTSHEAIIRKGQEALRLSDLDVIQCNYDLGQATTPPNATLHPVASPDLPCTFENDGAIDEVCRKILGSTGRVGVDPPVLHGYTDTSPHYVVGRAIPANKPVYEGESVTFRMEPDVPAGFAFDSATGVLSGTPETEEDGIVQVYRTITVVNSAGSARLEFQMTIQKGLSEDTKAFLQKHGLSMADTIWK